MTQAPRLDVNLWSDVACPWCWVGLLRFQQAAARISSRATVELKVRPYMIDPATKNKGEEYLAYNKRRWGSDSWTGSLRASGKADGANFSDWQWWPNTLKAHELIILAEQKGLGPAAKEALFKATYEEGKNVSEVAVLLQIAESLGLENVASKLESGELDQLILEQDQHAKRDLSISGVPHFVIGNGAKKTSLHGAQSVHAFEQALNKQIAELVSPAKRN